MIVAFVLIFQSTGSSIQVQLARLLLQGHPLQKIVDPLLDRRSRLPVYGFCLGPIGTRCALALITAAPNRMHANHLRSLLAKTFKNSFTVRAYLTRQLDARHVRSFFA